MTFPKDLQSLLRSFEEEHWLVDYDRFVLDSFVDIRAKHTVLGYKCQLLPHKDGFVMRCALLTRHLLNDLATSFLLRMKELLAPEITLLWRGSPLKIELEEYVCCPELYENLDNGGLRDALLLVVLHQQRLAISCAHTVKTYQRLKKVEHLHMPRHLLPEHMAHFCCFEGQDPEIGFDD